MRSKRFRIGAPSNRGISEKKAPYFVDRFIGMPNMKIPHFFPKIIKFFIFFIFSHKIKKYLLLLFPIIIVLLAFYLRVWNISGQIVMDDEMHALRAIQHDSLLFIFSHFYIADVCTPLALIYKFISNTIGLSEFTMRLPSLIFGLGLVIAFPLFVWRVIDAKTAFFFCVFLAISPLLIFYSRFARPYSIIAFCGPLSVFVQYYWIQKRQKRWALLYILSATLSVYFHILSIAYVCTPLLITAAISLINQKKERNKLLLGTLYQGALFVLMLVALYAAPFFTSAQNLLGKSCDDMITYKTIAVGFSLISGTSNCALSFILLALIVSGVLILLEHDRILTIFLVAPSLTLFIAIIFSKAAIIHVPLVFVRYMIPAVPVMLLFAAIALAHFLTITFASRSKAGQCFCVLILFVFFTLLYFFGPLPRLYTSPNNFTTHQSIQGNYADAFYDKKVNIPVSKFYYNLSKDNEAYSIIEAPWYYYDHFNRFHMYQKIHKKSVIIGFMHLFGTRFTPSEIGLKDRQKYAFRQYIGLEEEERIKNSGARYLLVHRDINSEMAFNKKYIDISSLIKEMSYLYGAPVYCDKFLIVFPLLPNSTDTRVELPENTAGCNGKIYHGGTLVFATRHILERQRIKYTVPGIPH